MNLAYRSKRTLPFLKWLLILILLFSTKQSTQVTAARSAARMSSTANLNDTWFWSPTEILSDAPEARFWHTAVWTGTEMIVWGGQGNNSSNPGYLNTGGRYSPVSGAWMPTSATNVPSPRRLHTAVWTGEEMIIWGGIDNNGRPLNTGGRYNPTTDTWTPVSTTNAPEPRYFHTSVWTGNEMIVWGGFDEFLGASYTGGRYNPATDTWTPVSTSFAPEARLGHTAVWAGSEMIVWGGQDKNGHYLHTGARYSPTSNAWKDISTNGIPEGQTAHTAVWTGGTSHYGEMIVWGGYKWDTGPVSTGARYNPATDTWAPVSTLNAPTARASHTAVWTGTEMIVWGGYSDKGNPFTNTGGRYNSATDTWTTITTTNAPEPRASHTAIWTGGTTGTKEMIIWGGELSSSILLNTGGRYHIPRTMFLPTIQR